MFCLRNANLLLNGCQNVTARSCAAGERTEVAKLWPVDYSSKDNYGAKRVSRFEGRMVLEHEGETVPVYRIDDILAGLDWQSADFLKVEGYNPKLWIEFGERSVAYPPVC